MIKQLEDLKGTANANDRLVEGYCMKMNTEDFCIFVMDELTGTKHGYALKIMYRDGKDDSVSINDTVRFPQVNAIFNRYCNGLWENKNNAVRKCYKYIIFGKDEKDKVFAVTIMRQIVSDIIMSSPIN